MIFFFIFFILCGIAIAIFIIKYRANIDLFFEELIDMNNRPKPLVRVIPNISNRISAETVQPDNTAVYLQRGWVRKNDSYQGYYRTQYGAWEGKIQSRGDKFNVYIYDPPTDQLRRHSRWPCFYHETGRRWKINLAVNPIDQDINSIILYVESVIYDSFIKS